MFIFQWFELGYHTYIGQRKKNKNDLYLLYRRNEICLLFDYFKRIKSQNIVLIYKQNVTL